MSFIGNGLIVAGSLATAAGTFNNLNPGGVASGALIAGGVLAIGAGLAIETLA